MACLRQASKLNKNVLKTNEEGATAPPLLYDTYRTYFSSARITLLRQRY